MSFLWMCLSLLYAASFLLSGASSDQDVCWLSCNNTVEVAAGETAILNCSIFYKYENCTGEYYFWNNTNGIMPCNTGSKEYNCEWDNKTYVSLTISNVVKEENYVIKVVTDCCMVESSIKAQIKHGTEGDLESTSPHVTPAVLSIFAGIFAFPV